jgi:glycosyltransferase involved in cell wall biosynthesis
VTIATVARTAGGSREGIVSVIIPAFNSEDCVADAIESALTQGPIVREVIVVDDGSTDSTAEVVRRFSEVVLLQQMNAGPAAARNAAIGVSTGEFIAPLDHDDLFTEGRLEIMVDALEKDPDALFVVGKQQLVVEPGGPLPFWLNSTDPSELERFSGEHGTGLLVMRRKAFDIVGLFDETMTVGGEDIDWVFRCRELGFASVMIDNVVTVRRMHGGNLTMDETKMQKAMFTILQRRAQRRRAQ